WQKQNDTHETIQEYVENSIFLLSNEYTEVVVSGRTDAGVHALNQVAHFDLKKTFSTKDIVKGLNYHLCGFFIKKNIELNKLAQTNLISYYNINCITIKSCEIVDETFHARFSSISRFYRYIILNQYESSTFDFNRVWLVRNSLNIEPMVRASKYLLGKHDFTSFRSKECQALSPIKTLDECNIKKEGNRIVFDLTARSFLHHMVRNIVGTLKDVGLGKKNAEDIPKILESKDTQKRGAMAPPCGLYIIGVAY
ncbi:MAG: tRNA pseudouridine(38-40) synthase TruA, partial [Rickettsiales bacterium]|nr:tRNA pseudouridine(38-40) synthase TruA [Rickettsiales bacterium]